MAPALSREQAVDLLDELLDEYIMPGFQKKLWAEFVEAGDDKAQQEKAVAEVCAPIEMPIVAKYGCESTAQALDSLSPELVADKEIARLYAQMAILLSPELQFSEEQPPPLQVRQMPPARATAAPAAPAAPAATGGASRTGPANASTAGGQFSKAAAAARATASDAVDGAATSAASAAGSQSAKASTDAQPQRWLVVGGAATGGIMVRSKEATSSELIKPRLAKGAVIEQLARSGDRLQFRRISGEGPETGWVSVVATGKVLLEPCG